ncbi:MAG: hypothetical protein L0211_16080 [Planctomycetaceae bacterium]|nr:hypothetical protein [Planctomycetaceae bacterium]
MAIPTNVCARCGGADCQCGQEIAGEVRRGRRAAPRRQRTIRQPRTRVRRRRRLPSWMVGTPWWLRRRPAGYQPAPPPEEPLAQPAEEPVSVAAAPADDAGPEPAAEPVEPVAGDEGPAGGEEELGAWIRRAAAAAIRAAPKPAAPLRPAAITSLPMRVLHGGGRGGGGGGGGGRNGAGRPDPILTVLIRTNTLIVEARGQVEQLNLDAAAALLNRARLTAAAGAKLTAAQEFFAPLLRAILRAQSYRFAMRPQFLNSSSVQPYIDALDGLIRVIDELILTRPAFRT